MRLQEDTHPNIFQPPGAYDGKKNLFSFHQFNFTAEEVDSLLYISHLLLTDLNAVSRSLGPSEWSSRVPTEPKTRVSKDSICQSSQCWVSTWNVIL